MAGQPPYKGNPSDPTLPKEVYPYRVTQKLRGEFSLYLEPTTLAQRFVGYLRHADPTTTPINAFVYPSANFFIPMKDVAQPRLGATLLGAAFTAGKNWPIIGHKKRFTNAGGVQMEVRVTQSDDYLQNDIIEVLYPNPLTGVLKWYKISYKIWGLVANTLYDWESVIPGLHRYYMDDWFDTNTDPSLSLNTPRLVWTNGRPFIYSWLGAAAPIIDIYNVGTNYYLTTSYGQIIYSPLSGTAWIRGEVVTGSVSGATALVGGTSVINSQSVMTLIHVSGVFQFGESINGSTSGAAATVNNYTPPPTTWASLGFTTLNGESLYINIDGNTYNITGLNLNTNSLLLGSGSPPPISVGDVAFSIIRVDATTVPMDVCRQNQNYMFYGNWDNRKLYMSNAFGHDATATITNAQSALDNLVVSGSFTGTGYHYYTILVTAIGATDTYQWSYDGGAPTTGVSMSNTAHLLSNGISVTFPEITGHAVGDTWTISVVQAVTNAWANFYYSLPRLPGEGYVFELPSNFWAMEPQESVMYVNTDYGEWGTIQSTLSANLLNETVVYTPLKQAAASRVIQPYMLSHMDNSLIYVNDNHKLDMIQRMKFIELPQIGNLSNPVQLDFEELSFGIGSSMEYHDKKLWINSAPEGKMLVYDELQKYWQPPQLIQENGILSVVNNTLISHSNLRNQTFNLFAGTDGDNGNQYTVLMRTSYDSAGDRWGTKVSNATFVEGYLSGNPQLAMNIYLDINGSSGIASHIVIPSFANLNDGSPLGETPLGENPLGSDIYNPNPHFYEIYRANDPVVMNWRFLAIELVCTTTNHSYSILSLGVNRSIGNLGNNALINEPAVSQT